MSFWLRGGEVPSIVLRYLNFQTRRNAVLYRVLLNRNLGNTVLVKFYYIRKQIFHKCFVSRIKGVILLIPQDPLRRSQQQRCPTRAR